MLDGILASPRLQASEARAGKDICLSLAVFLSVLLTAEHDGLCAVDLVDAVYDGIQTLYLLKLFSILKLHFLLK